MKRLFLHIIFKLTLLLNIIYFSIPCHGQLNQLVNTIGQYQVRADACGTLEAGCDIIIEKPAGATTVFQAYIYYSTVALAATDFGSDAIDVSGGDLAGGTVFMTNVTSSEVSGEEVFTRYEEVTALFAPGLNAALAATDIIYSTTESLTADIEGVGIVVIWNNPSVVNTAIHLSLGSLNTGELKADSIVIAPIDTSVPDFAATLGVGIVYSVGDALQRSTVWINELMLDDYAGGYDDGVLSNGALITLGGYGDDVDLDDEDELYDFSTFISDGDTQVKYEIMTSTIHDLDWFNALYFEVVAANPPSDTSICAGDSIFLGGDYQTEGGSYVDTLVSESGMDSIVTTILTVIPLPDIDAGVDTVSCGLTYILAGSSGSDSSIWSGSAETIFSDINSDSSEVTVSNIGVETIYLTVINSFGCMMMDSVIIAFSNLSMESDSIKLCNGMPDGEITVIPEGGLGDYSYQWDATADFQTTNPAISLLAGDYTLTLTDSVGCSIDSTFTIVDPLEFVYSTDVTLTDCGLSNGSVEVIDFSGGTGGYSYDWGDGPTISATHTDLLAGVYTVTVTDENSCDTTFSIEVISNSDFIASIDIYTNVTCYGFMDGTATATGSDSTATYSYLWNAAAGGQTTQTAEGLDVGVYQVLVIDEVTGCSDSVNVEITEPAVLLVNAGIDHEICEDEGESLLFFGDASGGTPGYTYVWDNDILDGVAFIPLFSAVYEVTVTDANGCNATDDLMVTVNTVSEPSFTSNDLPCQFTSELQNTTPGITSSCVWMINGDEFYTCEDVNYVFPGPGSYNVGLTVTSPEGCTKTIEIDDHIEFAPLPIAAFIPSVIEVSELNPIVDFVNNSEYASSYIWFFQDVSPTSNEVNPSIEFPRDVAAEYPVELIAISDDNCTDTAYGIVRVIEEIIFYVPNTFTPDGDDFNDSFQPVFTSGFDPYNYKLLIFNRWGELVFESYNTAIGWNGTYGGEIMKSDIYTWSISFKTSSSDKRVKEMGHVFLLK